MTEENKSVEANQPTTDMSGTSSEAGDVTGSPAQSNTVTSADATSSDEATEKSESIDPIAASSDSVADADDDTDYEAAFMELRATYADKERECELLKAEAEERQSQYLRLGADFENFRRRTQKEKEDLEVQVKCSTINELLSVVDNFERARNQVKTQTDSERTIHEGYQGVYKDLVTRLKKIGVSPMRAAGTPFDPNFHNAVMREPTAEHPEGTVIEELMNGYMLGDRVLRHAMVKVATPPEEGDTATGEAAAE